MSERVEVFIMDGETGKPVSATLIVDIERELVEEAQRAYNDFFDKSKAGEEHGHWNWTDKYEKHVEEENLTYKMYGIEKDSQIQGLLLVDAHQTCRIEENKGKHLIYVKFIAAAPWNSKASTDSPKYKLVGKVLLRAAINQSREEEFKGRLGLHSLPQAETFYSNCGMTDLGIDENEEELRYFEMTEEQANEFMDQ